MSGYIGTQPVPQATQTRDSFTATSGQTSFSCSGYTPNFLDVFLNGVKLSAADYTASNGSDVVLASGAATGDILEVVAFTTFNSASSSIDDNGNATAITIDSSENVGIGTSSPTAKFSVAGSTSGDYLAKIESTNQFGLKIKTTSTSNSHEQLAIHDGNNNVQFKVMGGGNVYATAINLGGTGSANKLDDYEEGGGIPSVGATTSGTISYPNTATSKYVKIGSLVTFNFEFQVTATGTGAIRVSLPFTPNAYAAGSLRVYNVSFSGTSPFLEVVPNDARAIFFSNTNNSATSSIMSTGFYYGAITYTTDS